MAATFVDQTGLVTEFETDIMSPNSPRYETRRESDTNDEFPFEVSLIFEATEVAKVPSDARVCWTNPASVYSECSDSKRLSER